MTVRYTPGAFRRVILVLAASSRLSGAELGLRAGLSGDVVGKVLTGRTGWPSLRTLLRLATC